MNVYGQKDPAAANEPIHPERAIQPAIQEEFKSLYPSTSYQKILDYHVAEILLSTIVLAVIALLRLHR